jgi:GNAT superfamily N-acetyltransferase
MQEGPAEIREICFEEILPLWRTHLWPQRADPIRAMSSMQFEGGIEMDIYRRFEPHFFGLYVGESLAGCNSCHRSNEKQMRSRGLYVEPEHRGKGYSHLLLRAVQTKAQEEHCEMIWSYPRNESLGAYLSFGFREDFRDGQSPSHSYVRMDISPL